MVHDRNDLRAELRRLRRDEGRTLPKLLASPNVRAALVDPPEAVLVERFDAAVISLGNDLKSLALKNAYAIGKREPGNLTLRRETFGSQEVVDRGPDTIENWENEKLDELVTRLLVGAVPLGARHLLVAVAVGEGRIQAVGEGEAESGGAMRQWANPNEKPFLPAFLYQLPSHLRPERLTISVFFVDALPGRVWAQATGDLLAWSCGDGRQELAVTEGGITGVDAVAHVAVHWDEPMPGVFYGIVWVNAERASMDRG
jgi:hypothetical protein